MQEEPELIARVNQIGEHMRTRFRQLGFDVGASETPIIPIVIGDNTHTFAAWKALYEAGIFTNAVVSPAVPPELSLLRTSYMATHTDEQLGHVLEAFEQVGQMLGLIG
jgi:8-amino-7-oxononanoate synthase